MKVFRRIKQLFTSSPLGVIENGAFAVEDGRFVWVGRDEEIPFTLENKQVVELEGKVVLPGFVDSHTHVPFYGSREDEYEMRCMGMSYMEIRAKGGGIRRTVEYVRKVSKEELKEYNRILLRKALHYGTTTMECKSGYGLTLDDEIKQLEVIRELNAEEPLDLVPTFLGAHEIPDGKSADEYIDEVIDWLPHVRELATFVDVFCEEGVFSVEHSRKLLTRAKELGFGIKLHAEEFKRIGGAMLAVELGATSVDHLTAVSDEDIQALSRSETVCVLLPGTTFFLGKCKYAPARKMLDMGCKVAISTDFNPGSSMTLNMQFMLTLANVYLGMTVEEAIVSATLMGAKAVGLEDEVGSIEPGKKADFLVFDVPSYRYIPYNYAVNNLVAVFKSGNEVL